MWSWVIYRAGWRTAVVDLSAFSFPRFLRFEWKFQQLFQRGVDYVHLCPFFFFPGVVMPVRRTFVGLFYC